MNATNTVSLACLIKNGACFLLIHFHSLSSPSRPILHCRTRRPSSHSHLFMHRLEQSSIRRDGLLLLRVRLLLLMVLVWGVAVIHIVKVSLLLIVGVGMHCAVLRVIECGRTHAKDRGVLERKGVYIAVVVSHNSAI